MNDGAPAFPSTDLVAGDERGMSLRDYFAAHALIGEYIREAAGIATECGPYSGRAANAYAQAEAMIARKTGQT